ncbi:MAG: metallophosphoesterase family protein [Phycisphaerae bacterium]
MRVGILSDSHGDAEATARAVALLEARGAEKLFHCGDLCSEAVLDELAGHDTTFVWGNCDAPTPTLRRYVAEIGLTWPQPPVIVELAGKRIGLFHGHEKDFRSAPAGDGLDYIFYGHTHVYDDRTENGCRLINPGALHRARVRTVALLDLASGELLFLRVDDGRAV